MTEEKANKNVFERPVREFKPKVGTEKKNDVKKESSEKTPKKTGKKTASVEKVAKEVQEIRSSKNPSLIADEPRSIREQILYPEMSVTGTGKNVRLPNGIYVLAQRMAKENDFPVYQEVAESVRQRFFLLPEEKQKEILDTIESGVALGFINL